jgi:hypothetical protein
MFDSIDDDINVCMLPHADRITVGAHATRRGRGNNGTFEVGQGSVGGVP